MLNFDFDINNKIITEREKEQKTLCSSLKKKERKREIRRN